jgi:hypothetical protein
MKCKLTTHSSPLHNQHEKTLAYRELERIFISQFVKLGTRFFNVSPQNNNSTYALDPKSRRSFCSKLISLAGERGDLSQDNIWNLYRNGRISQQCRGENLRAGP